MTFSDDNTNMCNDDSSVNDTKNLQRQKSEQSVLPSESAEAESTRLTPRFADVGLPGIPDQYADGKASRVWRLYVGGTNHRLSNYEHWLVDKFKAKGYKTICDAACGTGLDSVMLLKHGFKLQSYDASDKMLKFALQERWERRNEPGFADWIIEEATWNELRKTVKFPGDSTGFDALICIGNSFAHLLNHQGEEGEVHYDALQNFYDCINPGGMLVIDIRNYDAILATGKAPVHNIYYKSDRIDSLKTTIIRTDNEYTQVTLDYKIDVSETGDHSEFETFRLSYHPHTRESLLNKLRDVFGASATIEVYGDYKPISHSNKNPGYWIFAVTKPLN